MSRNQTVDSAEISTSPQTKNRENFLMGLSDIQIKYLLDTIPSAAYACDSKGMITNFNKRAEELWGRTPSVYADTDLYCGSYRLYDREGNFVPHTKSWMARALIEKKEFSGEEIVIERTDGSRLTALSYATPFFDEKGEIIGALNILVDITDRIRAEKELVDQKLELDEFFEHAAVGILWLGLDGTILRANKAELDLFGYAREEYVDHNIAEFHLDAEATEYFLERVKEVKVVIDYESVVSCKDGSCKNVMVNANVSYKNSEFAYIQCFTRDITERRRYEMHSKEAEKKKDEFIAIMAHELRNPLAPISSALQILQLEGTSSKEGVWALSIINRQLKHMTRLIDDLLDISRITSNKLELRKENIKIQDVLHSAIETSFPHITEAGHRLHTALPLYDIYVYGDFVRLAQVVANLLSNASKYTKKGGEIWLEVALIKNEVVITIRDSGIGISAELLPKIFDMFVEGKRSTHASSGLGIGLTLVKHLLKLHKGTIEVESEGTDKGSTFTIHLPAIVNHTTVIDFPIDDSKTNESLSLRILIADDNKDALDTMETMLRLQHNETWTANDGVEAILIAERELPDIVLLDLGMPNMSGYEAAQYIRSKEWGKKMKLIAVTGWGQVTDKLKANEAGFDYHLTKPVDISLLTNILASFKV